CFALRASRDAFLRTKARLLLHHRHGADRARGAAADLERKADEFKPALADDLIEVDQTLDVREAEVAADVVDLEIVAAGSARAHRFDAEHGDALLAEPSGRFFGQPGKIRKETFDTCRTAGEIHLEQDHVLRPDIDAGGVARTLKVVDRNV